MSSEFAWLTIEEVAPLIAKRKLSSRELLESLFCHIEQHDSKINAFLTMDVEGARRAAVRAESEILRGRYRGPRHGVPVAIKDDIWTAGSAHDRRLEDPGRLRPGGGCDRHLSAVRALSFAKIRIVSD